MSNDEEAEVFRGHLDECLQHFSAKLAEVFPKGARGATEVKRPLAEFCGVVVTSVTHWLNEGLLPLGGQRIKLMCFLDSTGYRVIELERIPKVQRGFAELVGYGLLSSQEAAELLGYASVSTLLKVLGGHHGASGEKNQRMWDLWKGRREELEQKKEEARQANQLDALFGSSPKSRSDSRLGRVITSSVAVLLLLLEAEPSLSELDELRGSVDDLTRLSDRLGVWLSRLVPPKENGHEQ